MPPLVEGWVIVGRFRASFLHGTFDKAIGESEATGKGDGRSNELDC